MANTISKPSNRSIIPWSRSMCWCCNLYPTLGGAWASILQVLIDLLFRRPYADLILARGAKNLAERVSKLWKELEAAESVVDKEAGIAQQEG